MPVVTDYTALLSGNYWNGIEVTGQPVIVTFSFPTSIPAYDASAPGFTQATLNSFSAFTGAEQTQALAALGEWASASGLVFIQVAPGQGDINFSNVDLSTTTQPSDAGGEGFYPFGNWNNFTWPNFVSDLTVSGDVFMNSQYQNADGTVNYGTLLHEIGHAIGLKHPTEDVIDFAAEPAPVDHNQVLASDTAADPAPTVMSTIGGAAHLQPLDTAAAAFLYGPAGTGGVYTGAASGTDTVSSWSWDPSTQTLTQTATSFNDTIRGSSVNDVIHGSDGADQLTALGGNDILYAGNGQDTLFGGTGNDTLVGGGGSTEFYVQSTTTQVIETVPGGTGSIISTVSFTAPANVTQLQVSGPDLTATDGHSGVTLYGDGTYGTVLNGTQGGDYIVGGAGNDTIVGGATDLMYGQAGTDLFEFRTLASLPTGSALTTIGDFGPGTDKIDLAHIGKETGTTLTFIGAGAFTGVAGQVRAQSIDSGTNTLVEGDTTGAGSADFQLLLYGNQTLQSSDLILSPACFLAGTRIRTPDGEIAVEDLTVGDAIVTLAGETRPVQWIGRRRIDCARHPDPEMVWPVRVRAGAFGPDQPSRDLFLSPEHGVFVDGVLIPIRLLINGGSIAQVVRPVVVWFHVELPRHDILLAEGLPTESYLDTGNRGSFEGGDTIVLHPNFASPDIWRTGAGVAPLAVDEGRVRPVWESLAVRSGSPARSFIDDPALHLSIDGRVVRPIATNLDRYWFALPRGIGSQRLISRAARPTDEHPWIGDRRTPGVCVGRIVLSDGTSTFELPLDHPILDQGWWAVEQENGRCHRWTDGDAALPVWSNARMLEVSVTRGLRYPVDDRASESTLAHVPY